MNARPSFIVAVLLASLLLAGCDKPPTETDASPFAPTPAAKDLKLDRVDQGDEPFTFPISHGPGKTGTVTIDFTEDYEKFGQPLLIQWDDGTTSSILCDMWGTNEVGVVDLYGPDDQAIVIAASGGGTGGMGGVLQIINPISGEITYLKIWQSYNRIDPLAKTEWCESADDPRLAVEQAYLEELQYALGYLNEETLLANPDPLRYAIYFWGTHNAEITDGVMTIQRHPGSHGYLGSVNDTLVDGDITYSAMFKGAVWAYDTSTDESFVVFHPDDSYAWPFELRKSGDWLAINTRGEGVVLVNVRTWHLKRTGINVDAITDFTVSGNVATINGDVQVKLPEDPAP